MGRVLMVKNPGSLSVASSGSRRLRYHSLALMSHHGRGNISEGGDMRNHRAADQLVKTFGICLIVFFGMTALEG